MTDTILTACSLLYVTLPAVIFFWGWLNIYVAVTATVIVAVFVVSTFRELHRNLPDVLNKNCVKYWMGGGDMHLCVGAALRHRRLRLPKL